MIPANTKNPITSRDICILRVLLPALFFIVAPPRLLFELDKDTPPGRVSSKCIFGKTAGKVYPDLDPRKEIAEKLLDEIPDGACVLVYSMAAQGAAGLLPPGHPGPSPAAGEDAGDRFNPNVTLNSVALTIGFTDRSSLDNSTIP